MVMKNSFAMIVMLFVSVWCADNAPAEEAVLNLTMKDAIKRAAENNLDVRIELYNPALAEADVQKNLGIYDLLLSALVNYNNSTTTPSSPVLTGTLFSRQQSIQFNAGASQLVPTGGTVEVGFNNAWNSNNFDATRSFTNYHQSELAVSFTQPLLKNFGRANTEIGINVARLAKEGSLDTFRTRLNNIVSQVKNEYFRLYALRTDLETKMVSLSLAQRILSDTQGRVKAGVLPAMEILNAEFGVATREKDIIDAQRALKDQMDLIRVLLQIKGAEDILPVDDPMRQELTVAEDEALTLALATRPELQSQRANVKAIELQSRVQRNKTLPELNFKTNIALTSLDQSYSSGLGNVASGEYPVWGLGLQFVYPLGNRAAENEYIRSKLALEQARTQLRLLESTIANDVRTAIRGLRSSYKQLEVTDRGRAFAEERLNAFIKKSQAGLATTKDVLDVENDLVNAKNSQIRALVDYNNAITKLWQTTGELLGKEGIRVDEAGSDTLYAHARSR